MDREVVVKYTPEIIRFAARQFWWRSFGRRGLVIFALLLALAVYFFVTGDRSWLIGFLGAAVLVCLFIGIFSYRSSLSRPMEKFKAMKSATARFRFTGRGIWAESDVGSAEISWAFIEKIWAFPNVWLLFYPKQGYSTLPVTEIDEELRQFIINKVTENSGKVVRL